MYYRNESIPAHLENYDVPDTCPECGAYLPSCAGKTYLEKVQSCPECRTETCPDDCV